MDYPAKILLFGEYGIILNSMALAIPYPCFSGRFKLPGALANKMSKIESESNGELKKLLAYFKYNAGKFNFVNLELFENEINKGLYFDSSIPEGSGLGSSGALTAAIYERYLIKAYQNNYQLIKTELGEIETFFHGKSSGFDPLISLLKKPVMMDNKSSILTDFDLTPFINNYTLFLIKAQSKGNTGALVNDFMKDYQIPIFKKGIDLEYIPIINQVIDAVIKSDFVTFNELIARYSEFQLSNFEKMIPQSIWKHFMHGIGSGDFHLKLCGSGGGGHVLGFSRNRYAAETYFNLNHLDWMVV